VRLAAAQVVVRDDDPRDRGRLRQSGRDVRELMRQTHRAGAGRRLRGQAQAHAAPTVHQVTDGGASAARMRDTAQVALSGPRPRFRAAQIYETSSLLWCMARAAN
jgi:hypothetical protein